jgi:hypothetical protein
LGSSTGMIYRVFSRHNRDGALVVVGCGDGRATCVLWYPTGLISYYVIGLLSPQIMAHQ